MELPEREKPWRPGDHPRPGPSWEDREIPTDHEGVPNGED
jgi:hypothetical protein